MTIFEWLTVISLGALMGVVGQSARVIVGLKKVKDQSSATGQPFRDLLEPSNLILSLLIGGVAGALAAIMTIRTPGTISSQAILALAAAGYSGSDFIEGVISRFEPTSNNGSVAGQINLLPSGLNRVPSPPLASGPITPLAQAPAPVSPLPT
jgi:putative chitinase